MKIDQRYYDEFYSLSRPTSVRECLDHNFETFVSFTVREDHLEKDLGYHSYLLEIASLIDRYFQINDLRHVDLVFKCRLKTIIPCMGKNWY